MGAPCLADACSCLQEQEQPGGETPESPVDDDPDCLCRGAIMGGELRTAERELATSFIINRLIDNAVLSSIDPSLASISLGTPHHFLPFSTGRDVCVLTCALLL